MDAHTGTQAVITLFREVPPPSYRGLFLLGTLPYNLGYCVDLSFSGWKKRISTSHRRRLVVRCGDEMYFKFRVYTHNDALHVPSYLLSLSFLLYISTSSFSSVNTLTHSQTRIHAHAIFFFFLFCGLSFFLSFMVCSEFVASMLGFLPLYPHECHSEVNT